MIVIPKLLGKKSKKWILEIDKQYKKACCTPLTCEKCKTKIKEEFYFCRLTKKAFCLNCEQMTERLPKTNAKTAIDTCGKQKTVNHQHLLIREIKFIEREESKRMVLA